MKYLFRLFCFTTVVSISSLSAAWFDTFKTKAINFVTTQATPYLPYLKKPETYAIAAAAVAGTYLVARELYWGAKSELPKARALDYLRSGIAARVQDQQACNRLQEIVTAAPAIGQLQSGLIQKCFLENAVKEQTYAYEFDRHPTIRRVIDYVHNDVRVIDHSSFVRAQTGSNCGYHAAFNGALLLQLFKTTKAGLSNPYCEALEFGPPIEGWKDFVLSRFTFANYNSEIEDINDAVIEHIMTEKLRINREDFTMISNPWQNPSMFDENLPNVIRALREGTKAAHIFLLGNMHDVFAVGGSGGHWIAALVISQGGLKVHVADSIPHRWDGRKLVIDQLIEILHLNTEWAAIRGDIESRLETAKTVLKQNQDYVGCNTRVRSVYRQIIAADPTVQEEFRTCYREIMLDLLNQLSEEKECIAAAIASDSSERHGIDVAPSAMSLSVDSALLEMYQFLAGSHYAGNGAQASTSYESPLGHIPNFKEGSSSRIME